jgi:hypothetical protein
MAIKSFIIGRSLNIRNEFLNDLLKATEESRKEIERVEAEMAKIEEAKAG